MHEKDKSFSFSVFTIAALAGAFGLLNGAEWVTADILLIIMGVAGVLFSLAS